MAISTLTLKVDSDVVKTEGPNRSSRDEGIIKSGSGVLACGAVLAQIGVGAATPAAKSGGNTGNGALTLDATTPVLPGAKVGVYRVRFTAAASNGGTYRVEDPNGDVIGDAAVGATFDDDLKFVIADGATDFIVGDGFDITIAAGTNEYAPVAAGTADGSGGKLVVLLETVDATSTAVRAVILSRTAEVVLQALVWPGGFSATSKTAALAALEARGVVARMGV